MKRLIILCTVMIAVLTAINTPKIASAEENVYFIICTPEGDVNARKHAKIKSEIVGSLFFGVKVLSDGKQRNGFIHVYDLAGEYSTGWVSKGYIVEDEPIKCEVVGYIASPGRVAARKMIGGKVNKWLKPGSEVMIYAISEQWCVTEYGFIRTEFLEIPEQEDCIGRGEVRQQARSGTVD